MGVLLEYILIFKVSIIYEIIQAQHNLIIKVFLPQSVIDAISLIANQFKNCWTDRLKCNYMICNW